VTRGEVFRLLEALERGEVRAAAPGGDGFWVAHAPVKEGILAAFRLGVEETSEAGPLLFRDRDTLPPRRPLPEGVRVVPGGTALRRGAYLAKGVVVMPPAYVNVGAFVDEGSMIDSHALVGSCAQVGKRVHLSAAAQVGGVLEPAGAVPVVLEDDVFVGGGAGVYEGVCVRRRAVLAAGVVLTASSVLFDLVNEKEHRSTPERPLVVPEGAVVVMGAGGGGGGGGGRRVWAKLQGLSLAAPVIVKYRDAKTDARTVLENALRARF
jgi:2,3,4,5-tetrahydropyridine-2,6-dicarboxylate N-succinyltransferase